MQFLPVSLISPLPLFARIQVFVNIRVFCWVGFSFDFVLIHFLCSSLNMSRGHYNVTNFRNWSTNNIKIYTAESLLPCKTIWYSRERGESFGTIIPLATTFLYSILFFFSLIAQIVHLVLKYCLNIFCEPTKNFFVHVTSHYFLITQITWHLHLCNHGILFLLNVPWIFPHALWVLCKYNLNYWIIFIE